MVIVIPISDFSSELFLNFNEDRELLITELEKFYSVGSIKPKITFENENIIIELDIVNIDKEQTKYNQLLSLCENGDFIQALTLAKELTDTYPQFSEYHRLLGQIYSELNDTDNAINSIIDSLRWNPKNEYALLMMGNIFGRDKKDIDTALIYYNEILKNNPEDYLSLNNIGGLLLNSNKIENAKEFFHKSIFVNPDYPNPYLGLAYIEYGSNNFLDSFDFALKSIQLSNTKEEVNLKAFELINQIAIKLNDSDKIKTLLNNFINELSSKYDCNIKIEVDSTINTIAKLELADRYNRDFHLIKYKTDTPSYTHLVFHELIHLIFIEDAKSEDNNFLFISNDSHLSKFRLEFEKEFKKLTTKGVSPDNINSFSKAIFDGINLQMYNAPIDLFIEDYIYNNFKDIRPIQFISLLQIIKDGQTSTTRKDIVENVPSKIVSGSKILNLTSALEFENLFKVKVSDEFKPTKLEFNTANNFYNEFVEYKEDKEEGEEYELIKHWSEDLNLDGYFDLVPESKYKSQNIDEVLESINKDPYNLNEVDSSNERKMREFIANNTKEEINLAVAMYMIEALDFFEGKGKEEIKKIAFELATLGMAGIDPNKEGYTIPSVRNKKMSGYQTLSFYYVSWALGIPEMLNQLQMPFDKEYKLATQFKNQ